MLRAGIGRWLGVPTNQSIATEVARQLAALQGNGPGAQISDPEDPRSWLSLDYVHDRVLEQLKAQNDRWEAADSRLRLILGLIGVVFAVTIGLMSLFAVICQGEVDSVHQN
jgi:hypothetical protein